MTIHVHLSEIETIISHSVQQNADRLLTVPELTDLTNRMQRIYELIAMLDVIASEARTSIEEDDAETARSRMAYISLIIRSFFADPSFITNLTNAEPETTTPPEPSVQVEGNVYTVDFAKRRGT